VIAIARNMHYSRDAHPPVLLSLFVVQSWLLDPQAKRLADWTLRQTTLATIASLRRQFERLAAAEKQVEDAERSLTSAVTG
jgi:hypothetical protein